MEETSNCVHTIASLPLDADRLLFHHYPAMKIGVRESVRFYASLLVPLVETIMSSHAGATEWVITGPPLYVIPAGANLVEWEVHRALAKPNVRLADLRYTSPNPRGAQRVLKGRDYSRSGVAERISNRQALHEGEWAPHPDPSDFRGRAVIFINDINVTGAQEFYARRTLETVHPESIHWLYIFQVEPELGRSNPEIEYTLNHVNPKSFEDFAEVVAGADVDYTSRCVSRLFGYPQETLEPLFRSLDEPRRKTLHRLATGEGAYTDEASMAKLALLA